MIVNEIEGFSPRNALQNAASIAGLMLTTEAMVHELPEKEKASAAGQSGMGGMYLRI